MILLRNVQIIVIQTFILCFIGFVFSQTGDWKTFDYQSTNEQLTSDNVFTVEADGDFLWFGTYEGGLCRYQKSNDQWTVFSEDSGLISNNVYDVKVDGDKIWIGTEDGISCYTKSQNKWENMPTTQRIQAIEVSWSHIWFGSQGNGIECYDKIDNNWYNLNTLNSGLCDDDVVAICADGDLIWFGTHSGVVSYEQSTGNWTTITSDYTYSIVSDNDYVWIGFPRGVKRYQKSSGSWKTFEIFDTDTIGNEIRIFYRGVNAMAVTEQDIWFAPFSSGVHRYNKLSEEWTKYKSNNSGLAGDTVMDIEIDGRHIWFCVYLLGVSRYRPPVSLWTTFKMSNSGLVDNEIKAIGIDEEYVWFGSYYKGVSRYQKSNHRWKTFTTGNSDLASNAMWAIDIDDESVWFASPSSKINRFLKSTEEWVLFDSIQTGLSNKGIFSIGVDSERVWFGGGNGEVACFDKLSENWIFFNNVETGFTSSVYSIGIDEDHIWFGTAGSGVGIYNKSSEEWSRLDTSNSQLVHNTVTSVGVDGDSVWFGTLGGLNCYDQIDDKWVTYNYNTTGFWEINLIWCVGVDGDYIWVGTNSQGVYRYQKTDDKWENFNYLNSGLVQDKILAIETYYNRIWISSYSPHGFMIEDGGVSRYADLIPPDLVHTSIYEGQPSETNVTILAMIDDEVEVKKAQVNYRMLGSTEYTSVPLQFQSGTLWIGQIHRIDVVPGILEYYLYATDGHNIITHPYTSASASPHRFKVYDSVPPYISVLISTTSAYVTYSSEVAYSITMDGTGSVPTLEKTTLFQYDISGSIMDSTDIVLNITWEEKKGNIHSLIGTFNVGSLSINTISIKLRITVTDQGHDESGKPFIINSLSNPLFKTKGGSQSTGQIDDPDSMAVVTGIVPIRGSAYGDSLKQYTVGYLDSLNQYRIIRSSLEGKRDGVLANWDTEDLSEGRYTLSLDVEDINGSKIHHLIPVVLDTTHPRCEISNIGENMVLGGHYGIIGTVGDRHFDVYYLEYGEGVNPQEWQIIGGIYSNPVIEDTLGIWNTYGMNGYYSLRLYAKDRAGLERTDLRVVILDNMGAHVKISSPGERDIVTQEVEIRGSVVEDNLKSYRVEYSLVSNILNWTEIRSDTVQVMNGVLASWNTVDLNGDYLIRLTAVDHNNHIERDSVVVIVDNLSPVAEIAWPKDSVQVGGMVSVYGTAFDANLMEYVLEYGKGESPEVWTRTTGTRFRSPVFSDLLGEWNTEDKLGIYCLRLSVSDSCGYQSDDQIVVDITSEMRAKEGGCIVSSDGFVELCLSPNSIQDNTHITINPIEMAAYPYLVSGDLLVSVYHMAPVDLDLIKPGLLRIHYSAEVLSDMEDERRLAIVRYSEEDSLWKGVGGTMETESEYISCSVDQLGWYSLIEDVTMGGNHEIGEVAIQPRIFSPRGGVYANETQVMFHLGRDSDVTVKIFNIAGRLVQTLCENQFMTNGSNTLPWDGKDHHGGYCVSGMYVVVIQVEDKRTTKTVMVLNQ